ncbi:unnamed protein product [Meloidogyne enterolobii]|uniref:Uncharacterized protein n=1 Tax=Meloidogyne enterolobii TaxID=390850 RepID=A0ACB1AW68_MELEN
MACDQAIFENNYLNEYLLVQHKDQRVTCTLTRSVYVEINNTHKYISKLNELEIQAEERINLAMGKGKNVVVTPDFRNYGGIKIGENKDEHQRGKISSGHVNQIQDDRSKGKGKMIESDDEMEYDIPNINEETESFEHYHHDWENFDKIFMPKETTNEFIGKHLKFIEN